MLFNNIKVALRGMANQKTHAIINISGLAIGITCTIIIALFVFNELNYDTFHTKADRIYRIRLQGKLSNKSFNGPITPAPLAKALVNNFPEVESAVRFFPINNRCIQYKNKTFYEDRFLYTDTSFFNIFDYQFIIGSKKEALEKPFSIVITESIAKKYFNDENPIGKTIQILNSDSLIFEISAVIKDMPERSHFHYDFITSTKALQNANSDLWIINNNYTYFLLRENANAKSLESKLPELVKRNIEPQLIQYLGINYSTFFDSKNEWSYHVQKLTDIHLFSDFDYEIERNGNISIVYIFSIVALIILIIACINFTNLSTARSMVRAREVALRKVMGSDQRQLIILFLTESILLCAIAVIISLFLIEFLMPTFNSILNLNLEFNILQNIYLIPIFLAFTLVLGLIAGSYPALYLSKFSPNNILKYRLLQSSRGSKMRNALVVFQFTISIIIILATCAIYLQLRYMQNIKLGFDEDKVLVIERTDPIRTHISTFIKELKKLPTIENASLTNGVPGRIYINNGFNIEGDSSNQTYLLSFLATDSNFFETMGIEILSGRFFSQKFGSDSSNVIINESTAHYLGLKNPVGARLVTPGPSLQQRLHFTIIGIVKNFYFEDLHKTINPILIGYTSNNYDGYITARIKEGKIEESLESMQNTWKKFSTSAPLNYFFLDKEFDKSIQSEFRMRKLMSLFAVLAIFIACLGLFGLITYTTARRTKELGVRKVMGASITKIVILLTKETVILVCIATAIAVPIALVAMNWWLKSFVHHIIINPLLFLFAGGMALLIAVLTIIIQAINAARRNPADALRYE